MDLRRVFSRVSGKAPQKSEKESFFLAVKISSTSVMATVWTIDGGKISIGEVGSAPLSQKNYEHLLKSSDQAISQASIRSAPNVEKAIFAVPHSWVIDGKIISEHLQTLRRLCKELDLVPLGYVVTIEALENYFKEIEGAPLTAILVGVDEGNSILTMYRAGKDLGTVPISETSLNPEGFPKAIEVALKKFSQGDALPSRIVLYDNGKDLEAIAQKITAYPWTGRLPFLHFPKVEKAPSEFVIKAVAAAGGLQMGAVLDVIDPTPTRLENRELPLADEINTGAIDRLENDFQESELEEVSPEEAGFVTENYDQINIPTGQDQIPQQQFPPPSFSEISPSVAVNADSFPKSKKKLNLNLALMIRKTFSNTVKGFAAFGSFFKKKNAAATEVSIPNTAPFPAVVPLAVAAFLLIIFGSFAGTTYFLPKANLIISVDSKNFNNEMSVGVTTPETVDPAEKSIPGSFIDVSEIGTKKSSATGQKLVGTKSKGSVTIYSVTSSKTFASGTTLAAPNGLKFTLDTDSTVASGDAVTPATATVSVHAAEIGDTYNLPANTRLTIGNLSSSDYLAKNDSAFSGGASHQATVVTKLDQDRLMSTLSAELFEQAKSDLQSKLGQSQTLLPNAITSTVSKKKFSKDIDAESDSISLDLSMDFRAIVFSKDDVVKLFATEFSSEIPSGYFLTPQNTTVEVVDAKTDKKGNAMLSLSASASLAPEIDSTNIVNHVSGKSFKFASDYISRLPGVSGVKLQVTPNLFEPILKTFLPWKKDNLKIEVVTQ